MYKFTFLISYFHNISQVTEFMNQMGFRDIVGIGANQLRSMEVTGNRDLTKDELDTIAEAIKKAYKEAGHSDITVAYAGTEIIEEAKP